MPQELLEYKIASTLRDRLATEYEPRLNMSPNAQLAFKDVYCKRLETGQPETIAQRMAAIAVDVASADLNYLPDTLSLEARAEHVEKTAKRYLERYVNNEFRANTPTNINFGRWEARYDDNGNLIGYSMKEQLGSACFVIPVEDTFGETTEKVSESDGILAAWVEQQLLQKGGGGTGMAFSALRPKGSILGYNPIVDGMKSLDWNHSRGISSGYESFLNYFYNSATEAIMQGSSRRGANMGIQRIDHMDFLDHIFAKYGRSEDRLEKRIKNFNLSLAVTDEFMEAVLNNGTYTLYNPHRASPRIRKILQDKFGIRDPEIVRKADIATREQFERILGMNRQNPFQPVTTPNMYLDSNGVDVINAYTGTKIGMIVDDIVRIEAPRILDLIVDASLKNGEPGMVFIDRINEFNPILRILEYEATNPCAEQPLPPHGACNLGSINAGKFARYSTFPSKEQITLDELVLQDEFTRIEQRKDGTIGVMYFDWNGLDSTIVDGIRFLDNIIDRSDFPSQKVSNAVQRTRKIGLGYMGIWDAMVLMKLRYGSDESLSFAEALAKRMHDKSRETSMKLAEERGVFPDWESSFFNPDSEHYNWFTSNPLTITDKYRGTRRLSDKVNRTRKMTYGVKVRNSYQTTEAPTGTIRRTVGEVLKDLPVAIDDNLAISSGIEPIFTLYEESNIINTSIRDLSQAAVQLLAREGVLTEKVIQAIKENRGSTHIYKYTSREVAEVLETIPEDVRNILVTSAGGADGHYEISGQQHVKISSIFQQYTDSAISKTINLPSTATLDDIKQAWIKLWESGAKGGTVYRDKSRSFQILNVVEDSKNTENNKVIRPLLQYSITVQLPFMGTKSTDGALVDGNPDMCFTTLTFNPINNRLTGVFQNIASINPELLSLLTHANIELSRTLKNGRSIDDVIGDLEKVRIESSTKGIIIDKAVIPNGSTDEFRYQVDGATTRGDLLNALYVARFLTDGGSKFEQKTIQERADLYFCGRVSLRSIINSRGQLKLEERTNGNPSILDQDKIITLPENTPKSLCPECG